MFTRGLITGVLGIISALTQQQTNGYVNNVCFFNLGWAYMFLDRILLSCPNQRLMHS